MRDKKLEKLKEAYAGMSSEQAIPTATADREALDIMRNKQPIEDLNPFLIKLHRYASPKVKKQIEKYLADDPAGGTGNWLDRSFDKVDRFLDRWL